MNTKKLVKVLFIIAFIGATGIFYSCNHNSEENKVVFDTKENDVVTTATPEEKESTVETSNNQEEEASEERIEKDNEPVTGYVYLCGAVSKPDVYTFVEGERVIDVLNRAGGFTEEASKETINLARAVTDGEQIYVPTIEEAEQDDFRMKEETSGNTLEEQPKSSKINLNTARLEELTSLPGIGQAKAQSIIAYRETNGAFSSIEDIMKIEGIKSGVFNKIQDYISVE